MTRGLSIGIKIGAALAIGTGLFFAIKYFIEHQLSQLQKYCYSIIGYKINSFTKNLVDVDLTLELGNRTDIDFTITGYTINATVNGKNAGIIKNKGLNQVVAARRTSNVKLNIQFNPQQVFRDNFNLATIIALFADRSKITIGLRGTVSVVALDITVSNIPLELEFKLSDLGKGTVNTTRCVTDGQGNLV